MSGQQSKQVSRDAQTGSDLHRLARPCSPGQCGWVREPYLGQEPGPPWGACPDPILRAGGSQVLQPKSAVGILAHTPARDSPSFGCWEDYISIPLKLGLAR